MHFNNVSTFFLLELKDFLNRHSGGTVVKNYPPMQEKQEMQFQSLGGEDPLE